jgi:hypothetical protein
MGAEDKEPKAPVTHLREPTAPDIANEMVRMLIARRGLRMAMEIVPQMQRDLDDVVWTQQQRHPEDWRRSEMMDRPPVVPVVQPAQTEPSDAKNTTKIPQIPRVGG